MAIVSSCFATAIACFALAIARCAIDAARSAAAVIAVAAASCVSDCACGQVQTKTSKRHVSHDHPGKTCKSWQA